MKPRMNLYQAAPDTIKALSRARNPGPGQRPRTIADRTGQDPRLADQRLRLLHQHAHPGRPQAGRNRAAAVSAEAWRESPLYTDRERAALAWTEAVTLIAETHAPDDVYEDVRAHFSEAETVNLTMLIATINAWNRIAISFRAVHRQVKARQAPSGERKHLPRSMIQAPAITSPSPWRTRHRSRAAGWSSGRACRWRRSCRRSRPPPARTRWRW